MKTGWKIGVVAGAILGLLSGVVSVLANYEKGGWGLGLGPIAMSTLFAALVCGCIGLAVGWLIGLVGGRTKKSESGGQLGAEARTRSNSPRQ
ncbi:MAG TPA: hypothetical protein VGZ47_07415 [Gemmataceae bacterium]|jgi:hypothetical protein|nr:hypothetical protein [Gemmataceae bacterium]